MIKTLTFILLWFIGALLCIVPGFTAIEGVSKYVLPLLFPNLKTRYFDDVAAPPVLLVAGIAGFLFASKILRVNLEKLRSVASDARKRIADFRSERTVVRLFYIILFGIPDGFYVLMIALGAGKSKSGDPSGMGDAIGDFIAVFFFPVMLNLVIMILSLSATPVIRRLSTRPWAQSHVRHSLVVPLVAVLLIWLAAGFSEYLNSWARLLRSL